jgi:hypothetical protein
LTGGDDKKDAEVTEQIEDKKEQPVASKNKKNKKDD